MERLMRALEKHFNKILIAFSFIYIMQMWLCSGTLAPYASTLANPHIINDQGGYFVNGEDTNLSQADCYYIANYDHRHYLANYEMLQGKPNWMWDFGIVHRRPLFFILSYPLMRMFGFLSGGFIMAVILSATMLVWFAKWVNRRWETGAAVCALLLISAYPASMYWSGLPSAQILLTSCVLLLTILLYKVYEAENHTKIFLMSALAGVSFLLYDVYIFFFPAFIMLLIWQKKWKALPVAVILMTLPMAIWLWYLSGKLLPIASDNSNVYKVILSSYSNMNPGILWEKARSLPRIFYSTFMGTTYSYLAAFFALSIGVGLFTKSFKPEKPFWVITISVMALFLFTNLAPDYGGWQLRGPDIARIYQPAFILCVLPALYILKNINTSQRRYLPPVILASALLVFIFNTRINIYPALGNDSLAMHHYRFYFHSMPETMHENLEKHGRRPLWVCP